jgi:sec-independent protein translocase protein TatB
LNISLSEIVLILIIALLVIKPEQLPDAARNIGRFLKAIKNLFTQVKEQMNKLIE